MQLETPFRRFPCRPTVSGGLGILLLLVSVSAAIPGLCRASSEPAFVDLSTLAGRWTVIESDPAESARFEAIDHAISNLSWVLRRMASSVLRRSTAPPDEIEFAWDGNRLHQRIVEADRERTRTVEIDELTDPPVEAARPAIPGWIRTDSGLLLNWQEARAYGSNLYWIETASRTLLVEHWIQITAIDGVEPIVFRSRFGRVDTKPAFPKPTEATPEVVGRP